MFLRPKFVTNSSSSCMIVWKRNPYLENIPEGMTEYQGAVALICPHCGETIREDKRKRGEDEDLDIYMDDLAEQVVRDKMLKGCRIFYQIEYMGTFPEDEQEHGNDESGWYSFQC